MELALYIAIFLLVVASIWLIFKLNDEKRKKAILLRQNSKLAAENTLLQAEQLKFQLQPHTLNNLLTHLRITARNLNRGLDSLSETLEYILYKGNKQYVSIEEEMGFIKEYLKLNDLFLVEIDAINEDYSQVNRTSRYYTTPCIPHLITAYFIENAFKHGKIAEKDSLKISLKLTDYEFEMIVVNKIRQTQTSTNGGLGLSNMKKRLDLLKKNKYHIDNKIIGNEFHSTLKITF
jgi:LytS/YehU family sensor histidine kinase